MLISTPRPLRRAAAPLILLFAAAGGLRAQDAEIATVRVARENFRAAPGGTILAEVMAETELPLGARQDRWREATLEGWVWGPSLRAERRDGHDLVVAAGGGENLRAVPNGPILARLRTGMRLDRVEERSRWVLVRRSGWVWEPSLEVRGPQTPPPVPPGTPSGQEAPPGPRSAPTSAEQRSVPREFTVASRSGTTLLESPAGDTLARVAPGASVQVLAREGDWARVRLEGWTYAASLGAADSGTVAVLRDVSAAALAQAPDRYRGRLVDWSIQFIALQEAERFRTDFIEGEPFILARGPGDEAGFVYIAVPPDRVQEVERLLPLQRVRVLGRVRMPSSPLTGAPVIDLLELRLDQER